ncbi:MAG: VOC family protein [Cyclobacteriaceae bacterium]|nr:MAG: VOC family protein [Cyclobacteriaceae bacterium]
MTKLNPYLTFKGNCEEAFDFYKSVFGGTFSYKGRFSEMPEDPEHPVPEKDKNKIMHVSLPIGEDYVLMGSDSGGEWGPETVVGNNFSLSISVSSKQEADNFHRQLSDGGKVSMPMADTFWGDYFGMCTDRFGINWMVSFTAKQG